MFSSDRVTGKNRLTVVSGPAAVFQTRQNSIIFSHYIPWAMRSLCLNASLLADEEMREELKRLLGELNEWRPKDRLLRKLSNSLDPARCRL